MKTHAEGTVVASKTTARFVFTVKWLEKLLIVVVYGKGYEVGVRIQFPEPKAPPESKPTFDHKWHSPFAGEFTGVQKRATDIEVSLTQTGDDKAIVSMIGRGFEMSFTVDYLEQIDPLIGDLIVKPKKGHDTATLAAFGTKPAAALPAGSAVSDPPPKKKPMWKFWG